MKLMKLAASAALAGLVAACAYPVTTVEQGGSSSGVYFVGAPETAQAIVDGTASGNAAAFDGQKAVLVVPAGTHRIVVRDGGSVLVDQVVYVGEGHRVSIRVP